jgi:hypothetical protein
VNVKKFVGLGFALTVAAALSAPASAETLLSLVNAPGQSYTPYSLSFIATGPTTTISIGGYQKPQSEQVSSIGFFLDGAGANLLGSTWVFTAAASGSDAATYYDGTSVPALNFGGLTVGDYDVFSQTIATITDDSYTLDFLYSNWPASQNQPSGLLVTEVDPPPTTPLPSTWTMMIVGIIGFGLMAYRRQRQEVRLVAA